MSAPGPGKRVLLVEDEPDVADTLAQLLQIDDHRVDLAADGLEALECVRAVDYDAILCDVRMPRLDGLAFYAALGRVRPHLVARTAFVTANTDRPDIRAFFAATGALWLEKPTSLEQIREVVRRLTGG